jgi:antitoxin (DNA-binding transcriptional repressor) of toxin-antitoxin stability system
METMAISNFKTTCLAALKRVRRRGRPLRITRFGKLIADIQASKPEPQIGWLGSMRETGSVVGELVKPPNVKWEALE